MHTKPSEFANDVIEAIGDCAILLSTLIHGSTVAPHELGHDGSGRVYLKAMSRAHNFDSVEHGLVATREAITNLVGGQPIQNMQTSNKTQLVDLLHHLRLLELEHQSAPSSGLQSPCMMFFVICGRRSSASICHQRESRT